MVIIDVYGKIHKTVISEKLRLYVSNVPDEEDNDWKSEMVEIMEKEILQQELDAIEYEKLCGKSLQLYNDTYLKELVKINFPQSAVTEDADTKSLLNHIAENMIYLFFDYEYDDMPFFDWTTNCFDGRLCEDDYAEKVINFIRFVNKERKEAFAPNCVYTSNDDSLRKSRILQMLSFKKHESRDEYTQHLKKWGERIDGFIENENSYYKFDFISNAIFKNNGYNTNHLLSSYSLIEMLLLKSNEKTDDVDRKLVFFLKNRYGKESKEVAILLRQMRNKIGHADFLGFIKKADRFSEKFMKNFSFDYTEYSHQNWVLLHVCCLLDDLLSEILFMSLKEKDEMIGIINIDKLSKSTK